MKLNTRQDLKKNKRSKALIKPSANVLNLAKSIHDRPESLLLTGNVGGFPSKRGAKRGRPRPLPRPHSARAPCPLGGEKGK